MRFTLFYRGPLKSNRGPADKQAIRRQFHSQLKCLWAQPPLADFSEWLSPEPEPHKISLIEKVGAFQFLPLVSDKIHMVAELDITMLRPGPPGALVSHAGDLDNRVKTLLDALRVPRESNAIPENDCPGEGEVPFFCLLDDDRLVTHLSVATDRLLESTVEPSEVVMLIHVTMRATRQTIKTIGLGS